jgi:hypothetical protein
VALEIERIEAQEAKTRLKTSTGGAAPRPKVPVPEADKGQARDKAAAKVGVSGRLVSSAKKIAGAVGGPELIGRVRNGELRIADAQRLADIPRARLRGDAGRAAC